MRTFADALDGLTRVRQPFSPAALAPPLDERPPCSSGAGPGSLGPNEDGRPDESHNGACAGTGVDGHAPVARPLTVPAPRITVPNPEFEALARSRATLLCLAGHSDEPIGGSPAWPCVVHLHEVRRALFEEYMRQEAS